MLSVTIHELGDAAIFECTGRITLESRDLLRGAVLARNEIRMVILDFAHVSAVDAAGLGILIFLRTWAKSGNREIKLTKLTPRVREVLALTNLMSIFDVCPVQEVDELMCRRTVYYQGHNQQGVTRVLQNSSL